eukprot:TRINITY_DN11137_c0_g1_i1.p1 TRINITY_DN11137_c0_g1~~TRINITY_DN11137_c0_g1_i1.p1  ORF type:complete len:538 (+),score=119.45 TRINITY_DN11137_c0_g1_i1:41-1654(+)
MPFLRIVGSPEVLQRVQTDGSADRLVWQVDATKPLRLKLQGLRNVLNLRGPSQDLEGHTLHRPSDLGELSLDTPAGQLGLNGEVWVEAPPRAAAPAVAAPAEPVAQGGAAVLQLGPGELLGLSYERRQGPLYCTMVDPGGAAERAGLPPGAQFVAVNGQAAGSEAELTQRVQEWKAANPQGGRLRIDYDGPVVYRMHPSGGIGLEYNAIDGGGISCDGRVPGSPCDLAGVPIDATIISIAGGIVRSEEDLVAAMERWRESGQSHLDMVVVPNGNDQDMPGQQPTGQESFDDSFWDDGGAEQLAYEEEEEEEWDEEDYYEDEEEDEGTSAALAVDSGLDLPPPPSPIGDWQNFSFVPEHALPRSGGWTPADVKWPEYQSSLDLRLRHGGGVRRRPASRYIPRRDEDSVSVETPDYLPAGANAGAPGWLPYGRRGRFAYCAPDREQPPSRPPNFVSVPVPVSRTIAGSAAPVVVPDLQGIPQPHPVRRVRLSETGLGYRGVHFRVGSNRYTGDPVDGAAPRQHERASARSRAPRRTVAF